VSKFRVLLVDDEPRITKFLKIKLKGSGYAVLTAESGEEALEQVLAQEPDLVVLDIIMPGMDGFETLKQLRAISGIPVIILSAKGENTDKITGLDLGADDYLAKPFSADELVARIEAIRRRMVSGDKNRNFKELNLGNITVNFEQRIAVVNGHNTHLTRIEWLLLSELAQNVGSLMLYEDLLTRIWGSEYRDDVQILRTWISRLRNKLTRYSGKSTLIRTVPKTGYIIDVPSDD
jgi:two-component system KDP operon response regulator KdpE